MKKIGFVLEGGGLRGAYQAGAIKALYEKGIRPSVVTGTSIGALGGALISLGKLDLMLELYKNFEASDFFKLDSSTIEDLELEKDVFKQLSQISRALMGVVREGGIDISPMEEMLRKEVQEDELRKSPIKLGLVTLALPRLEPVEIYVEDIPQGQVHDYLLASAYLPFFKAEERRFVDGWFVDNFPLNLLEEKGPFDHIYMIRTHGGGLKKSSWYQEGVTLISPSRRTGRVFNLDLDKIHDNLEMGYYDTLRILEGHAGHYYTIRELPNLMDVLVDERVIEELYLRFGDGEGYDPKRFFYEEIMPGLAKSLGFGVEFGYQEILLELLESGARHLDLDTNRVYDLDEFLELIRRELEEKSFSWSLRQKLSTGMARYTRGWLGDLENFTLAFLDLLVDAHGRKNGNI